MKISYSILILAIIYLTSCNKKDQQGQMANDDSDTMKHAMMEHGEMDHHHHEGMEMGEASGSSIFNLSSVWKDQNDDTVLLSDLGGKMSIISMIYTHCQYACPKIVADMNKIKRELDSSGVTGVNYVLVSMDTKRDDPERLMEFSKENNFDQHWTLLTGDPESVMEIAAVLGVKYKVVNEVDFSHSNLITTLNQKGEIVHRQEGLGNSPDETVMAVMSGV